MSAQLPSPGLALTERGSLPAPSPRSGRRITRPAPHLLERPWRPDELVDHVEGDADEGRCSDEVPHRDAPLGVLVVEERQRRLGQEGADDYELRGTKRSPSGKDAQGAGRRQDMPHCLYVTRVARKALPWWPGILGRPAPSAPHGEQISRNLSPAPALTQAHPTG